MQTSDSNNLLVPGLIGLGVTAIVAIAIAAANLGRPDALGAPSAAISARETLAPGRQDLDAPNSVQIQVANGESLVVPTDSVESEVASFLIASKSPSDGDYWHDFRGEVFATEPPDLTEDARAQLVNLAKILVANPGVKIMVRAHWTPGQDPAAAQAETSRLADAAKEVIVGAGVSADRIDTEGYGDRAPKNTGNPDSAENRRLSIRVTEKPRAGRDRPRGPMPVG